MRTEYQVIFSCEGSVDEKFIRELLGKHGLHVKSVRDIVSFDDWLELLPDHDVPGLANKVLEWFEAWGMGGGDYSTEVCAEDACTCDNPRQLARSIYDAIANYAQSDFDAQELVMDAIDDCLYELANTPKEGEEYDDD